MPAVRMREHLEFNSIGHCRRGSAGAGRLPWTPTSRRCSTAGVSCPRSRQHGCCQPEPESGRFGPAHGWRPHSVVASRTVRTASANLTEVVGESLLLIRECAVEDASRPKQALLRLPALRAAIVRRRSLDFRSVRGANALLLCWMLMGWTGPGGSGGRVGGSAVLLSAAAFFAFYAWMLAQTDHTLASRGLQTDAVVVAFEYDRGVKKATVQFVDIPGSVIVTTTSEVDSEPPPTAAQVIRVVYDPELPNGCVTCLNRLQGR